MKVNVNYKGKSVELDIPDEKLEELVKERKQTGWEKPKIHGPYNTIQDDGFVCCSNWRNGPSDNELYLRGNFFTSRELAENIARYQTLDLRIRRRIAEICEPVDWSNPYAYAYGIVYSPHDKIITPASCTIKCNGWICDTREHAEQIIEEFKDELTWYFTEFKDRMDG
jgi:hypothetical protein